MRNLNCASTFWVSCFHFFFFNVYEHQLHHSYTWIHYAGDKVHSSQDLQPLYSKKIYIKNGSHGTIQTFKKYFVTVFSIFSFLQNKLYPKGPYTFWKSNHWLQVFYILNTYDKFCDNRILFTKWCTNLVFIHNFKLQKLAI